MLYRKKPVVVEAFRLGVDYIPDWFMNKVTADDIRLHQDYNFKTWATIKTLEGNMTANFGDYIIQGVNGEIYPCKPDIFEKTYEIAWEE